MIKKISLAAIVLLSMQCTTNQVYNTAKNLPSTAKDISTVVNTVGVITTTTKDINEGLKQALGFGIESGVAALGKSNGFYQNSLVMIALPPELKQVDSTLRNIGLGALSDEGLKLLNRAAEDAVTTASPIFVEALNNMSFSDVQSVLLGSNNAATQYLQNATTSQLVNAFSPKIKASLDKVGADKTWSDIITQYNMISGKNINPDLTQYVTQQAIKGVFVMVAQKELDIRTNVNSRTTDLLQRVFVLQDNK